MAIWQACGSVHTPPTRPKVFLISQRLQHAYRSCLGFTTRYWDAIIAVCDLVKCGLFLCIATGFKFIPGKLLAVFHGVFLRNIHEACIVPL